MGHPLQATVIEIELIVALRTPRWQRTLFYHPQSPPGLTVDVGAALLLLLCGRVEAVLADLPRRVGEELRQEGRIGPAAY